MNRYIFTFMTIGIVITWTINTSQQCECSQWNEQFCTIGVGCLWNTGSSSCQNYPCSAFAASICNLVSYCYYFGSSCLNFNSCSSLPFTNQTACNSIHGCQYYTGDSCSDFSCSNYSSNSTECTSNWQCLYSNGVCTQATSCSQYDQEGCPNGQYCYWNGQVCSPATCNSLSYNSCTFVYTTLAGSEIQPCIFQESLCVDAIEAAQFNSETNCFSHTDNLYYWYYWNGEQVGECVSCTVTNPTLSQITISFALMSIIILIL